VLPNLILLPNLPSVITSPTKGNKGLTFALSIKTPPLGLIPFNETVLLVLSTFETLDPSSMDSYVISLSSLLLGIFTFGSAFWWG